MRKRDDEKERRIKEAVINLILQEGWNGASMSKIAKVADVSPSTVYVYFESKDDMLRVIYREYSEDVFTYLLNGIYPDMPTNEILASLIRGYYNYILENPEIFCFVEQFSGCPALVNSCEGKFGLLRIYELIDKLRLSGSIRNYDNEVLNAAIFYPVKAIAFDSIKQPDEKNRLLNQLIDLVGNAILI